MPDPSAAKTPRVRFAPSPTGYLHVGGARTFIFNWLYARHNHGTLVLRLDDTDLERNTEASVQSIFSGLRWLGLSWDEEYKQSERLALHRRQAEAIFAKGLAYRDFTPAHADSGEHSSSQGAWLFNPGMRELSLEESDRRAASGEPFALRYRVPRGQGRTLRFTDAVYGEQSKLADEVEDFALLRSDSMPTYHLASCVDDADLRITHIIRGQDHLTNTFKHLALFEALGVQPPQFAHVPLLVAPDGAKLSKRRHGPVVSVTTYRDAGFLPQAFVNFLCLLGWSPKDDREFLTLDELTAAFTLEAVNRANAVVNFTEDDPFDPKAVWLNAEHIRALAVDELSPRLQPFFAAAGLHPSPEELLAVTPFPGSPLYERIREEGTFDEDWEKMDCMHFQFVTHGMTRERLEDLFQAFYRAHFKRAKVLLGYVAMLWRSPDSWLRFLASLPSFLRFTRTTTRFADKRLNDASAPRIMDSTK